MRIEIAGLSTRIIAEDRDDLAYLKHRFRNFIVDTERVDFYIKISKNLQSFNYSHREDPHVKFTNPLRTEIIRKSDKFYIIYKKKNAIKTLGYVDRKRKLCELLNTGNKIPKRLFNEVIRRCFHIFLEYKNGFLLHASCAILDRQGYVFTGPAECGKSTAVKLLSNSTVVSDECTALKRLNNSYRIFSTPFHGNNNVSGKLKAIFFPRKAKEISFKKIKKTEAFQRILSNIFFGVLEKNVMKSILETVAGLIKEVPCYEMYFSLSSPIIKGVRELYRHQRGFIDATREI